MGHGDYEIIKKLKFKGGAVIQSDIFIAYSDDNKWPTTDPTRASLFSDSQIMLQLARGRGRAGMQNQNPPQN